MNLPPSLRARVLAEAAATPSRTRPQARRATTALLALSLVIAVVAITLSGGIGQAAGRPLFVTVAFVGGWGMIAAFLTWLAIAPGRSTLRRRPALLAVCAVSAPVALFLWMFGFHQLYEEPFVRLGSRCFLLTVLIAATPLVAFVALRPGVEPRRPRALGALMGAAGGAWASVVVGLWCPLTHPAHALVGHVAPLAVLVTVGALLGGRLLGIRSITPRA